MQPWKSIRGGKVGRRVYMGAADLNTGLFNTFGPDYLTLFLLTAVFGFLSPCPAPPVPAELPDTGMWHRDVTPGCVTGCPQGPPPHKVTAQGSSITQGPSRQERRWKGSKARGEFGGGCNLVGVHLPGFAVSKLAVKNGPVWGSRSVWQLLTMQPFNSIITFLSLWGAVSGTIPLYFYPRLARFVF